MTDSEIVKAKELIKMLREAYNAYYDTSKGMPYNIDEILRESAFCLENCLNEINHLDNESDALLADIDFRDKENKKLQAENEKWQSGYMTQKQEIANLEIELKAMRGAANSYKAENERLRNLTLEKCCDNCIHEEKTLQSSPCCECFSYRNFAPKNLLKLIKSEAYKEFADRLKMRAINRYNEFEDYQEYPYATITHIDELLKELAGEEQ